MTKQQAVILDIMLHTDQHLSAEEVFLIAKKKLPSIAMGTVYRNLNILSAEGKLNRVEVPGSPDRYDKNIIPHDNLYCDTCHELKDIQIEGLKDFLEEKTDVDITSFDVVIHYICENCK